MLTSCQSTNHSEAEKVRIWIKGDFAEFPITNPLRVDVSVAISVSIFTDKRTYSSLIFGCGVVFRRNVQCVKRIRNSMCVLQQVKQK